MLKETFGSVSPFSYFSLFRLFACLIFLLFSFPLFCSPLFFLSIYLIYLSLIHFLQLIWRLSFNKRSNFFSFCIHQDIGKFQSFLVSYFLSQFQTHKPGIKGSIWRPPINSFDFVRFPLADSDFSLDFDYLFSILSIFHKSYNSTYIVSLFAKSWQYMTQITEYKNRYFRNILQILEENRSDTDNVMKTSALNDFCK